MGESKKINLYDRLVQAFYWPVTINTIISIIVVPLTVLTDTIPDLLFPVWTWITIILTAVLALMVTFDMQSQRAIMTFNDFLKTEFKFKGYQALVKLMYQPDSFQPWLIQISGIIILIWKVTNSEHNPLELGHLFSIFLGPAILLMSKVKYLSYIHDQVVIDHLSYADYSLPIRPPITFSFMMIWLLFVTTIVAITMLIAWFGFGKRLF